MKFTPEQQQELSADLNHIINVANEAKRALDDDDAAVPALDKVIEEALNTAQRLHNKLATTEE